MSTSSGRPWSKGLAIASGTLSLALLLAQAFRARLSRKQHAGDEAGGGYRINAGNSLAVTLLAFAADLYAIPSILRSKPDIGGQELKRINDSRVPRYDRLALHQTASAKDRYKKYSDQLLRLLVASFTLLFFHRQARREGWKLFLLYAHTHAIAYTFYTFGPIGPAFQNKYRPVVYYTKLPEEVRRWGNNRNSQYSGHTTNAAAAAFFIINRWLDFQTSKSEVPIALSYLLATLPPALVGYWRVKALKHFPSDVALAMAIGAVCGVAVPACYQATSPP